jgi:predicted TPR repeat methyltransferase
MPSPADLLAQAWRQHQAGNLAGAETLYRQVLAADPQALDAHFLLGFLCQNQGRLAESEALYRRYLQLKPVSPEVWNALGVVLGAQRQSGEAFSCFQQALRLKPDSADALHNLGFLHAGREEWQQALALYQRALQLQPRYPEALNNLGTACCRLGRLDEAVCCFQQALALRPGFLEALNNLGNARLTQGQLDEAASCYRQVLRLRPDHAPALGNLGVVCMSLQQWEEALHCWQRSLVFSPNDAATHRNLGRVYYALGRFDDALACFQRVLALGAGDAEVRLLVDAILGKTLDRVPAEYVAGMYDSSAGTWDRDVAAARGYRSPELLKEALGPPPPHSLDTLDLGCGTGLCGLEFRGWAQTLVGVDLSARMAAQARQRGIYDELIVGDILTALQERTERFDLILASDVLLYLGDLEPVFRAVHQALRPGGRFAFTVDTTEGADYRLQPVVHFAHSRDYLRKLAATTGLLESRVIPVVFPRSNGQSAAGLVVVLSRPEGAAAAP